MPGLCVSSGLSNQMPGLMASGGLCSGAAGLAAATEPQSSSLALNLALGRFRGAVAADIACTRATTNGSASYQLLSGTWVTVADNVLRQAPGRGVLSEVARTNGIQNNTMVGINVGGNTLPTRWTEGFNGSGLTRTILGTGTEDGATYFDIRISGTSGSTTEYYIAPESTSGIAAANGDSWAFSAAARIIGGATTGLTNIQMGFGSRVAAGAVGTYLSTRTTLTTTAKTATSIGNAVSVNTGTISDASTQFVWPVFYIQHGTGAVDVTVRIGPFQMEKTTASTDLFATSMIFTTNSGAGARGADVDVFSGSNLTAALGAGTAYTLTAVFNTPQVNGNLAEPIFDLSDGSANNRVANIIPTSGFTITGRIRSGGSNYDTATTGNSGTLGARSRSCTTVQVGTGSTVFNGGTASTSTPAAMPISPNKINLGSNGVGSGALGGYLAELYVQPALISTAMQQWQTSPS